MEVEDRIDEMVETVSGCLGDMDDADRSLTLDMLRTYCWFAVQLADLTERVNDEGTIVEVEKGGAKNRHKEKVENPAIGTIHKLSARKSEYFTKLMRVLPRDARSKMDSMDEFLQGK